MNKQFLTFSAYKVIHYNNIAFPITFEFQIQFMLQTIFEIYTYRSYSLLISTVNLHVVFYLATLFINPE